MCLPVQDLPELPSMLRLGTARLQTPKIKCVSVGSSHIDSLERHLEEDAASTYRCDDKGDHHTVDSDTWLSFLCHWNVHIVDVRTKVSGNPAEDGSIHRAYQPWEEIKYVVAHGSCTMH